MTDTPDHISADDKSAAAESMLQTERIGLYYGFNGK